jgi:hypothetical protein
MKLRIVIHIDIESPRREIRRTCYNVQDMVREAAESGVLIEGEREGCRIAGWGQHVEYPEDGKPGSGESNAQAMAAGRKEGE